MLCRTKPPRNVARISAAWGHWAATDGGSANMPYSVADSFASAQLLRSWCSWQAYCTLRTLARNLEELYMNGTMKVAALAALSVSAAAFGADPSTDKTNTENALPEFSTLDKNGDGAISKDEAREQSWVASRYGELDGDKNGKLSGEEYKKAVDMSKAANP